ncbi:UDP-N-acetylmuramate:L-alanyl-gamma-D-glutamyl-meso-diaminopimelate ligase [Prosthecochloris sp. N3]|uniref:UDP-N-acetylmuramate:L-alanyl-gamma-D-glutamyl-meso-diaminopimelate ligase n=1 Tax=Prosthecochloris ethylica TaxID=2743976 RepID=A0ABR9XT39_9CHLB|nr:UDP-N-acetylmuramate:L-alanyl-gamma-D-glutamyl-meso-diaminopimelate ligase [Prosthecochloris ethylica]MBF0585584.1 UDP-N-acetylmuramate:L-alanyl-gamma-D-glutamyl-meso-diaminopimelate ligase [Prosthecochloris ethylica]MBF0637123.1 UDP-N-acetylmuramate:L-alanyl-gamma-D-glutamyl-meso-diaminopimelate ligase [Prosthecochloris ethylica]NUK46814.1 UDP-N-acetylmuramate:L-alanyl-gamma-D-glutamyl-meso-diaminopimelate ligase [Prosthecochloris ethylica]
MSTASIYFIGIGGTAMASVAVALSEAGYRVSGSDTALYPPMSDYLSAHRIACRQGYDKRNIEQERPDLIVVGNAQSRGNPEVEYALNNHLKLESMPEIVSRLLINGNRSVVVTGTHGKTTTTSLAAWLFESGGRLPGFLVGGIAENFNCGCRPSGSSADGWFLTEGDEYDTAFFDKRSKFMHYRPDIAIMNNIEFDHADIFSSLDEIKRSFHHFINLIPSEGLLLCNAHDQAVEELSRHALCRVERFGLDIATDWSARNISFSGAGTSFELFCGGKSCGTFRSPLHGKHNLMNTLAATAAARAAGIAFDHIRYGLERFMPPKRRMDIIEGLKDDITLIDDFAHHPTAVRTTLEAVRQRFGNRRLIACFEPRSNTSTRNIFQDAYLSSFDAADVVILGKVHRPERYAPDERLDTRTLAEELIRRGKTAWAAGSSDTPYPADIRAFLETHVTTGDVVILLSNGSFDGLKSMLSESFAKNS